ncbi:MAG: hypothetical protein KJ893_04285 [Candidatus Omnitrophica bacterium]|nr:hypothetical protein [Candidatus Omnitrophota bacterium]
MALLIEEPGILIFFYQLFNGKLILSMGKILEYELAGRQDLFYDQTVESTIRQLLESMSQNKQLTTVLENKRLSFLKSKNSYDEDFKLDQEMNLKSAFKRIKEVGNLTKFEAEEMGLDWNDVSSKLIRNDWAKRISAEEIRLRANLEQEKDRMSKILGDSFLKILPILQQAQNRKRLEEFDFERYYAACPNEQKVRKLQKLLEINAIVPPEDISSCLDSQRFPRVNLWLRSWYAYHYYTVQRKQPTLRKNDATDLNHIISACCVDHFITNDGMLKDVGNICFKSEDRFISWDNFESRFFA